MASLIGLLAVPVRTLWLQVMTLYGTQKAFLEFEFFGEVGTGLGPTLEFYTLVSKVWPAVLMGGQTVGCGAHPRPMNTGVLNRAVLKSPNFFLLRTASKDYQPPTANRHQPPPTSECQPPTANRCQPPPTATNLQVPTTNL